MGSLNRDEGCPTQRWELRGEYGPNLEAPEQGEAARGEGTLRDGGEDPITSQGPKGAKVLGGDGGAGVSHGGVAKPGSGHLCRCSKAHQTEVILCPGLGYRCGHQEQEDRCEPLTPTARPAVQRSPGSARVCPHHSSRQSLSTNWSPMASRQLTSAL